MTALVWFRNDLRLTDHLALQAAVDTGLPVLPIFILDEVCPRVLGGASKWWLHQSLKSLKHDLTLLGSDLILLRGNAFEVLKKLKSQVPITHLFWHRRYDPKSIEQDKIIKAHFKEQGVACQSFSGSLLFEPHTVKNKEGNFFKVFTPFWNHCLGKSAPDKPIPKPRSLPFDPQFRTLSEDLESWNLCPKNPDWAGGIRSTWTPGETRAQGLLSQLLEEKLDDYKGNRDQPSLAGTSSLSPYLHWGEISVRQVWHAASGEAGQGTDCFLSELGWREFAYHTLFYNPHLIDKPLRADFKDFPWQENQKALEAWQKGLTGYPIVDAGMRELWITGFMHNRVRMIVASFLVKHLLQPWQKGEDWFWDTLVDADLASNSFNWQWVAGCGADAAPYFRIFNPILQGEKFDPKGIYVKRWVPELSSLPDDFIHKPWLSKSKPSSYPSPLVDHQMARKRALEAFQGRRNE